MKLEKLANKTLSLHQIYLQMKNMIRVLEISLILYTQSKA